MAADRAGRGEIRATDSNRTSVCEALDSALASGQLDRFEHHERVSAATRATYVSELRPLLTDLQGVSADLPGKGRTGGKAPGSPATPDHGEGFGRRISTAWWGVLIPVLIIGGSAIYTLTNGTDDDTGPAPNSPGVAIEQVDDEPADAPADARVLTNPSPLTLDGLRQLFSTAAEANPSGAATRMTAHPEHASMEWVDPEHPSQTLRATYRGGWDSPDDRPTSTDVSFRLTDLDAEMLAPLIAGAPQTLGVADGAPSHIIIDADDAEMPTYTVYASNDVHQSGYFEVNHRGETLSIYPAG